MVLGTLWLQFRRLFYLVTPAETSYPSVEAIPPILEESIPWFIFWMALETAYVWKKGWKGVYGINDAVTSMGAGFVQLVTSIALRMVEMAMYVWIYEHWRLCDLAWDSPWTWLLSFVAVDFAYYWFHRAGHEVNLFWAMHQMHHSSEYYNLSTALRQGMFQQYASMFFYLPEALLVPPQVHVIHTILSLLYQFWIHTQVIGNLGLLEKIINTPSSHRVHHGRNRYCIDKNYGGVLIVWDRLFGTYQPEMPDTEPVSYGLVSLANSFDAMYLQIFYLKYCLWDKPRSMEGLTNKLKAVFYGPGWHPGTGRCGDLDEIPDVDFSAEPYDTRVPAWISVYVLIHGILLTLGYTLIPGQITMPWTIRLPVAAIFVYGVQVLSYLLEKRKLAPLLEISRCLLLYFYCCPLAWPQLIGPAYSITRVILLGSSVIWIPFAVANVYGLVKKDLLNFVENPKVAVE